MKQAYIKYLLALLLFGSNGVVASYISLTSYEIVFLRSLIGSILLISLFKLADNKIDLTKNKRHLLYLIISGVAMGVSWIFLYEAYQQIGVSIASLAYYCGPVIVMLLSPVLFKESAGCTSDGTKLHMVCGWMQLLFSCKFAWRHRR